MKTRGSSKKAAPLSPATKRARWEVVNVLAQKIIEHQCFQNGRRAGTYGYAKALIEEKKRIYTWLSRDQIYSRINRLKKQGQNSRTRNPQLAPLFNAAANVRRPPQSGRPKGSTAEAALKKKNMRASAIQLLCERMKKEREPRRTWKSLYDENHDDVMKQFGLEDDTPIPYSLVKKRLQRGSLGENKKSPVSEIEPVLVTFAAQRQEAGQPLKPSEGLMLANSLIYQTRLQSNLVNYQAKHRMNPTGELSKSFWRGFLRRHQHILSQAKGSRLAASRQEWTTYENLEMMYDLVYEQMVDAGVARQLSSEEEYWVDLSGKRVERESTAVKFKVQHAITHPEWILFGDEVGTDMDQTDDGQIGGQIYLVMKDTTAALTSSVATGRFTVIGFTAATGDPVMCLIIFAAEELTIMQRVGYDMRPDIPYNTECTLEENSGPGKAFPGAPICYFRGKKIPAYVAMSPKGSITSEILKGAFQRFDELGIYKREPGGPIPFALFDAHDSRLQLPFLNYVNEKVNEQPRWKVCIGLPNGTALWQVGDSTQQNGCWKMAIYREKDALIRYRQRMGLSPKISKEDIIPIVNRAWAASFARKEKNLVAIRERGWNPLDKRLLLRRDVQRTRHITREEEGAIVTADSEQAEGPLPEIEVTQNQDEMSTITQPSISDLNFTTGVSGDFAVDLLQHLVRKREIKENLQKRYEAGQEARGKLDAARKLTGGTIFKSGRVVLDEEVASIRRQKEDKKLLDIERPIRNAIEEYRKRKIAYQEVKDSKKSESLYGKKEHKAIIHFLKCSDDPAVPTNSGPIRDRYEAVKGRHETTLTEYLADRGYKGEVVTRVVTNFIDENGNNVIGEWM